MGVAGMMDDETAAGVVGVGMFLVVGISSS